MRSAALILLAGCAIGAPPGFSQGDTWTVPLLDPMADGRLIVPVTIHGKGPYLFLLDRDSSTIVDPEVVRDTGVRTMGGTRLDDYTDRTHPAYWTELTDVEIGTLTISLVRVAIVGRTNLFDDDGRHIAGILGNDLLADSLVWGFDRDRGIAWLQTQQAFHPPAGATVLDISKVSSANHKIIWQPILEGTKVAGVDADLHYDFFNVPSSLVRDKWAAAKATVAPVDFTLVDESGTPRHESEVAIADVTVAGITREHVGFTPYADERYPLYHLDGTLGLDFFRPFKVAADWHHGKIYLSPREDAIASRAQRIARWGDQIPVCQQPGCVAVQVFDHNLDVKVEPNLTKDLEVVVRATRPGPAAALPLVYLNLPARTESFAIALPPEYEGSTAEVIDVSPFPRQCANPGPCPMIQQPLPP